MSTLVSSETLYRIEFYVPPSHLEAVKNAIFATGAGRVGDYDCCAWQTLGQGQYRPLEGARPFAGQSGRIETVEEYKVELVCKGSMVSAAVAALRASHPYEEPAFAVLLLQDPQRLLPR
ncbi:MAG: hypothetical protein RLZZ385_2094 [Pseudomonadota bacterium]|jgi:hypothetical protein